jgi:hypothetical protein
VIGWNVSLIDAFDLDWKDHALRIRTIRVQIRQKNEKTQKREVANPSQLFISLQGSKAGMHYAVSKKQFQPEF